MEIEFTLNNLVRFIYKETSASETLAIQEALQDDISLRRRYSELKNAHDMLPKVKFNPSTNALKNIMRYSGKASMETQF